MASSVSYVFGGSTPDKNPEITSPEQGDVYIRKGMRVYGGASESIEDTEAYATFSQTGYTCIGGCYVLDQLITVWSNNVNVFIGVNTTQVLFTPDIPYTANTELDVRFSTDIENGEIFLNDRETSPLIFSIKSMLDAVGTTTYTTGFNINLYKPTIEFSMSRIVFKELINVGNGLKAGSYNYAYRLVNKDGDRTQWSVSCPFIPVVGNVSIAGSTYPGVKTYGKEPGSQTKYGILLRVRIHNTSNFSYVELKRVSYSDGAVQGAAPVIEYMKLVRDYNGNIVNIKDNELQILDIIDTKDNQWLTLPDEEDMVLSVIEKASAQRYYDRRIWYGGVTYESRNISDLPDNGLFLEDTQHSIGYPIKENIGSLGYRDIWNQVYKKSLMLGERYGYGIVLHDGIGGSSFALPYKSGENVVPEGSTYFQYIKDLTNYKMPERREHVTNSFKSPLSNYSYQDNSVLTSTVSIGSLDYTHEVVKNRGVSKADPNKVLSISMWENKPYVPMTPTRDYGGSYNNATDQSGLDFRINTHAGDYSGVHSGYNPKGFKEDIFATGMGFSGIDTSVLPDWVKGFSIVRSAPAGRVVCQGLAMYSLEENDFSTTVGGPAALKALNKVWFYSPDMEIGDKKNIFDDLMANPGSYSFQLVSPVGFFSESYSNSTKSTYYGTPDPTVAVDLAVYAKIMYENGIFNKTDDNINTDYASDIGKNLSGGGSGHVAFGRWRHYVWKNWQSPGSNFIFNINNCEKNNLSGKEGRSNVLEITLSEDLYGYTHVTPVILPGADQAVVEFDDTRTRKWHEPFYVVNIIKNDQNVSNGNFNQFETVVHYQKLRSVIGLSDGSQTTFDLVDERIIDAQTNLWIVNGTLEYIVSNAVYDVVGSQVIFHSNAVPPDGARIEVRYNNAHPIDTYNGDIFIGDSSFTPIDASGINTGQYAGVQGDYFFSLKTAFPYQYYLRNPKILIPYSQSAYLGGNCDLRYIRQMAVVFTCESRVNLPLLYGNSFPQKNYVIRPYTWRETNFASPDPADVYWDSVPSSVNSNNIHRAYYDDYEKEFLNWRYGGFHMPYSSNPDYQSKTGVETYITKPLIGYEEKVEFPQTVIWSMRREPNVQDDPGIKTFLSTNSYTLQDGRGIITKLWDAYGGKGNNLYVFCERGIGILITNKSLIYGGTGDLNTIGTSKATIGAENWPETEVGLPEQYIMTAAEYSDVMIFLNNKGVFLFNGDKATNITNDFYSMIPVQGTAFDAIITNNNNRLEYWLQSLNGYPVESSIGVAVAGKSSTRVSIYDLKTGIWTGIHDVRSDKMISGDAVYFMDQSEITMSTDIYTGTKYIEIVVAPDPQVEKEFISVNINSTISPTKVWYGITKGVFDCYSENFYKYTGYFAKVPLKSNGKRLQGKYMFLRIEYTGDEKFSIVNVLVEYKQLKLT